MGDWYVESDSAALPGCSEGPSSSNRKKVLHYVNDLLTGDFFDHLAQLRRSGALCDVVLEASSCDMTEAEGNAPILIDAHKIVLAAASPYFRAMFTSNMLESTSEKVVLKDIDGAILSMLVEYMYTGKLSIDESTVQSLLSTASILQLNCVKDACSRYLLDQLDVSNCLGIAAFANLHSCSQLATAAQTFTQQRFKDLVNSEELLSLNEENFLRLIEDDRLTTKGEEVVFDAVMNWVNHDLPNRKARLPRVFSAVRLPLLSKEFLFNRVHNDPLVKESSECKDLLLEACRYLINNEITNDMSCWLRPREPVPISQLLMLVGGQAPKAICNVDTFDPDSQRWSSLCPLPHRRCRCGVAQAGDFVYAVGGFNGSARVRSVDVYNPTTDSWMSGPSMDARRSTLGVAVSDGVLVAVGGFDGATGLASTEMLDPRTGQWTALPSMETRRSSVGVAAMNGIIYAVGGYDGHTRQCLNTVELYDFRANRWRMGPSLREVRSGAGVTVCGNQIVAAGGHEGSIVRDSVEILRDDCWEMLPAMTTCRRNAGIIGANGHVFAIGGDDGTANLASMEYLDLTSSNRIALGWRPCEMEMANPRSYSGVALLPKL